jgi:tetratricopeptide (TPR) repeat protein
VIAHRRSATPVLVALLLACAEWRMPPTFPRQAAGRPVIHEQAVLGLSAEGDLAAAQLVDADGEEPRLTLLVFGRRGEPTRTLLEASRERAAAVAQRLHSDGRRPAPILGRLVAAEWPDAVAKTAQLGYARRPPALPEPGSELWRVTGARNAGALPLVLRTARVDRPAPATALLLSDPASPDEEIELARMPLAGGAVPPELWIQSGVVWMLAGSVLEGEPLHRAVGLRRGSLARGEAELHDRHGFADYSAGELDAARREFARAIAADPRSVDALYNAASTAALLGRAEEAVDLLRRAAAVDPARVQVLGRNDEDLKSLRTRPDVRALLGLRRLPPEGVPPPP